MIDQDGQAFEMALCSESSMCETAIDGYYIMFRVCFLILARFATRKKKYIMYDYKFCW